jgi:hypothetical protein
LQQFQRATTADLRHGDHCGASDVTNPLARSLSPSACGSATKVTPGTTRSSHHAIQAIRDPGPQSRGDRVAGAADQLPVVRLRDCPGRDIEVDKYARRTIVYCGDKKARCEFSRKANSAKFKPHIRACRC